MKQILVIAFECGLYYSAYWMDLVLPSKPSIHESGKERIGQGNAVGSLIVQGGLQS